MRFLLIRRGLVKGGAQCFAEWDPKQIIQVDVVPANQALEEIVSRHESIDIVKIDVEGYENKILSHFDTEVLSSVKRIYAETLDDQKISGFSSERYGGLTRYFRA